MPSTHGPRSAPGTQNIGSLFAISAATGKTLWRYDQRAGMMSVVATGGGLLFAGDTHGRFRAFDQDTGKILWETNLGAPVTGYPITYVAHGKKYVAVSVGNSLASSSIIVWLRSYALAMPATCSCLRFPNNQRSIAKR
jgi:outer membrane protein assembly factor BamB